MSNQLIDYAAVLFLGAMIGFVEILARYKDAPFKVAFSYPGTLYIGINAGVAGIALWGVRLFGIEFGSDPSWSAEAKRWLQVGLSGLSAMTLFRSSLFNFRVDEQDVSVGPNAILQILLVAVDKEVDRLRGAQRARVVEDAMDGINFRDAVLNLPPVVLSLMQNLTDRDRNAILNSVKEVLQSKAPERSKTMTLGLSMINIVGEDILKAAIDMANLKPQAAAPKAESLIGNVIKKLGGPAETDTQPKVKEDGATSPAPDPKVSVALENAVSDEKIAPAVDKLRQKMEASEKANGA